MKNTLFLLTSFVLCLSTTIALAQETVPQPAAAAAEEAAKKQEQQQAGQQPSQQPTGHQRSWEAEPVYEEEVTGQKVLKEEDHIGDYKQPRWTAARRFPTTRIYVMPAGTLQLEYWLETTVDLRGDDPTKIRTQYEVETGLGHRLQLDFYLTIMQIGGLGKMELEEQKIELRYALADWGVIPTNPTLYLEFARQNDGPPKIEAKILLGGEIVRRWHWGANLVFEGEIMGDDLEFEYNVSLAFAYTLLDQLLSLGLEVTGATTDTSGNRFAFENYEILAGPSIQWRPTPPMHIDLVALFGAEIEKDGGVSSTIPLAKPMLVVGWEF